MATSPPADAANRAPAGENLLPQGKAGDGAEIKFALSTASVLWSYGAPTDALEWVRRAVRHAADAGQDERAMELAKAASAIAGHAEKLSVPPPAMPDAPGERATSEALAVPPPPAMPTGLAGRIEPESSVAPPVPLVTKPSMVPRPDAPSQSVRPPPAPAASSASSARLPLPPRPASSSANLAIPRGAMLPSKRPPAPSNSAPGSSGAAPVPSGTAPVVVAPAPALAVPAPALAVPARVAPPPAPSVAPPPVVSKPSVAPPPMAPVARPLPKPSVAPVEAPPPAVERASAVAVSQAVRAFVARGANGSVTARLARDGEPTPAGQLEVMLVALSSQSDLAGLFEPAGAPRPR